jgi:ribonucleoside-triphosphate reductase
MQTYSDKEKEHYKNLQESRTMDLEKKILSDITVHMKYAKYVEEEQRRENWEELVQRNMNMHLKKFPHLSEKIQEVYQLVKDKKILPSMRSMQFGGKPIEVSPNRIFNCAYAPADDPRVFGEIMFLLLGGTGVGYSVQKHHVERLPEIRRPSTKRTRRFLIGDSIEGWADAVKALMQCYFKGTSKLRFDFSDIRPKGARLVTSGGKAPGPQPLRECLVKVEGILDAKENGDKLSPIEVHDIICHIADAVLAGGIRRAALISLFSADDDAMLGAKSGSWWELNPQRGRSNNSVVLMRHKVTKESFMDIWKRVEESRSGEPGFYLSNDKEWGCNPCCEIGLRPFQFCNLVEINVSDVKDQEELNHRARSASFIATLQASYTDFHYLRPIWKRNTERDALIGVSMTGIASGGVLELDMSEASLEVNKMNREVAMQIGIKKAARTTCVKPAGTTSLTLGTSSGIHAWHNDYYIRRLRVGKNEAIYSYLAENLPELIEDCRFRPHDTAILSVPQKAPEGAITRHETALDLLARVKKVSDEWIKGGHHDGNNTHNVSATVTIKDEEWPTVGEWMWENRHVYNGLSVLPYDGGTYVQAPFEDCDKETYERMLELVKNVDLDLVIEQTDETDLSGEIACGGGACEIF